MTTEPSSKIAANALRVACICCTPLSWSWTAELSPAPLWSPQATAEPSAKIAANARCVACICCTPLSWSWTAELSPPCSSRSAQGCAADSGDAVGSCCNFGRWFSSHLGSCRSWRWHFRSSRAAWGCAADAGDTSIVQQLGWSDQWRWQLSRSRWTQVSLL